MLPRYIYAFIGLIKWLKPSMSAASTVGAADVIGPREDHMIHCGFRDLQVYNHFPVHLRLCCVGLDLNPFFPPPLKRSPSAAAPHWLNSWADVLILKFGAAEQTSADASQSYILTLSL